MKVLPGMDGMTYKDYISKTAHHICAKVLLFIPNIQSRVVLLETVPNEAMATYHPSLNIMIVEMHVVNTASAGL